MRVRFAGRPVGRRLRDDVERFIGSVLSVIVWLHPVRDFLGPPATAVTSDQQRDAREVTAVLPPVPNPDPCHSSSTVDCLRPRVCNYYYYNCTCTCSYKCSDIFSISNVCVNIRPLVGKSYKTLFTQFIILI